MLPVKQAPSIFRQPRPLLRIVRDSSVDLSQNLPTTLDSDNSSIAFAVAARGGMVTTSLGASTNVSAGYAAIQPNTAGAALSGMAIFGFRQNNVLVSEAAVPSSPLISSGRLYAEVSSAVNTGVAMANPNGQPVTVTFHFTDTTGS